MERHDRLTTLIDKFKLTVSSAVPEDANLVVHTALDGTPRGLASGRGARAFPLLKDRCCFGRMSIGVVCTIPS